MVKMLKFTKAWLFLMVFVIFCFCIPICMIIVNANNGGFPYVVLSILLLFVAFILGVNFGRYGAAGRIIDFNKLKPGEYRIDHIYYCKDKPNKIDLLLMARLDEENTVGVVGNFPESMFVILEENEYVEVQFVKKEKIFAHNEICALKSKIPKI